MVYDVGPMLDPAVGALLAGAFALLFVTAALQKFFDLGSFAEVLRAYRVLPRALAPAAPLVPLLELGVAAGLLSAAARAAAALAGAALLCAYAAAIAVNLARGRRDLSCGCGGANDRRPIAPWMVWRNIALAGLVGVVCLPQGPRALGAADALTIGAGTAVAALLYMSLDTLLGRISARAALPGGAP